MISNKFNIYNHMLKSIFQTLTFQGHYQYLPTVIVFWYLLSSWVLLFRIFSHADGRPGWIESFFQPGAFVVSLMNYIISIPIIGILLITFVVFLLNLLIVKIIIH